MTLLLFVSFAAIGLTLTALAALHDYLEARA
jgi:hypothetical protein